MTRMAHAYAQAPVMTRMALAHARASDESDGTRAPVMTRNPMTVRKPPRRVHGVGPPPRVSVSVDSHGVSPVTASVRSHGVGPSSQSPCEAAPPQSNPLSEPPMYSSLSSGSFPFWAARPAGKSLLDPCPGLPSGPVDLGRSPLEARRSRAHALNRGP